MQPDRQYIRDRIFVTPDTCWLWTMRINEARGGYGQATWRDGGKPRTMGAHKLSYVVHRGYVPEGLELDHAVCQQPSCVNPDHMEPVTHHENMRRNMVRGTVSNQNVGKTGCPECGGPYSLRGDGRRICRPCSNRYSREWKRRKKGAQRGTEMAGSSS